MTIGFKYSMVTDGGADGKELAPCEENEGSNEVWMGLTGGNGGNFTKSDLTRCFTVRWTSF